MTDVLPAPAIRFDADQSGRARGVTFDADLIEAFSEVFLKPRYDHAAVVPAFHREMWRAWCGDRRYVVRAAPRGHAKSSSITHAATLASVLFGWRDYVLLISDTEAQAVKYLRDIRLELVENELLIQEFGIEPEFEKDTETEIVVRCGAVVFNVTAKGAEQKIRGLKWRGKRPNLVVIDDLENEELVASKERRDKLREWVMSALLPAGSESTLYRMVGTILHMDSVLQGFIDDKNWDGRIYEAHSPGFAPTAEMPRGILWPEKFSRERLEAIRATYVSQGKPEKYSQEYLNKPLDEESAFFRREMFQTEKAAPRGLRMVAAIDLAVSTKESADYTAIVVAGVDSDGLMHVVDVRRGRWDSLRTVEEMFSVQREYSPELFCCEKGPLQRAFRPFLEADMLRRSREGVREAFLNIHEVPSTKDKVTRAHGIQAKMKAGALRFVMADWFPDLLSEMTRFPRDKHDDMVDCMSLLGQVLHQVNSANTPEEDEEEEYAAMVRQGEQTGVSPVTGY